MTLVVGLGNPGEKYRGTRHNVGFEVVDRLVQAVPELVWQERHHGLLAALPIGGVSVRLLKPQTFMNLSGESVASAASFFRIPVSDVLVVHDELDLPLGQLRLKQGGGDAGHNGLRSVSAALGASTYGRLRVGIGRPPPDFSGAIADYVLRGFASEELPLLPAVFLAGAEALKLVIHQGLANAMNQVNRRLKPTQH